MLTGYYTIDSSDLYMYVRTKYVNEKKGYFKAKVTLYYKYGEYKGTPIETKNYKVFYKNVTHWKKYVDTE